MEPRPARVTIKRSLAETIHRDLDDALTGDLSRAALRVNLLAIRRVLSDAIAYSNPHVPYERDGWSR